MKHFPIYLNLSDRRVVVSGAGRTAAAKIRLLAKTEARLQVFGAAAGESVLEWAAAGRIAHFARPVRKADLAGAALLYCASDDAAEDARAAALARELGIPANIADNLDDSGFITPAIVDRDPVTVAIGTEGTAPMLARGLKAEFERRLPSALGALARIGGIYRSKAGALPTGRIRRRFWSDFFFGRGPQALSQDGEARARQFLHDLLDEYRTTGKAPGLVSLVGAGPGDPELLTLKARNRLHEADVIIHDRLVSDAILDLARREALAICVGKTGFGCAWRQDDIDRLTIGEARAGRRVLRLKSGDPAIFGRLDEEIDALEAAGIDWEVIPGVSSAMAAAAGMGVSLTRRGRNSELRIVTGHDAEGFAQQDWAALARHGAVTAVYMGKRAASFLRGRLLMHGAAAAMPVTVVENASRPDRKIVPTTLFDLPDALQRSECHGPAVILLGLWPRGERHAGQTVLAAPRRAVR